MPILDSPSKGDTAPARQMLEKRADSHLSGAPAQDGGPPFFPKEHFVSQFYDQRALYCVGDIRFPSCTR
jgi:hypothetical protein